MSASRVLPSTAIRPTNQERSMTMPRMPQLCTTTGTSPRSCGRRQMRRLHGTAVGRRAFGMLCAVLLVVGWPARAASQTPPPSTPTAISPAASPPVVVDVTAWDPKVVIGVPETLGREELVESAGTTSEIVEFYGYDAIGSVRMVFDPAGTVVGEATYSPFGIELAGTTGMPSQRFTGQERDHEAQLDYFNARSLQARTGRFSAPDPVIASTSLRNPQRWNRYAYAINNPLTFIDPSGLRPCPATYCIDVDERLPDEGSGGHDNGGEFECSKNGCDPGSGGSPAPPVQTPPPAQPPPGPGPGVPTGPVTPVPGSGTPSVPVGTGGAASPTVPGGGTNAPTQRLFPPESIRNTPLTGKPETWLELYKNKDVVTMRRFGPNGTAQFDIDINQEHKPFGDVHGHWWEGIKRIPISMGQLIRQLGGSTTISPVITINPCLMSVTMCTHYDSSSKPI